MLVFIVLAGLIAIFYQNILSLGFSLASLNLALFPVVFGSLYWKLNDKAVFWSLALGFMSVVLLFISHSLTPANSVISLPVVFITLVILQKIFKPKAVTLS